MTDYRIESAGVVSDRQLKVRWNDGLEGVIDCGYLIDGHPLFGVLGDPERFPAVKIEEYGHLLYWEGGDDYELDICPDVLRAKLDPKLQPGSPIRNAGGV